MRIPLLMATYRATIYRLADYLHYSSDELKQDMSHTSKTQVRYMNTHMKCFQKCFNIYLIYFCC